MTRSVDCDRLWHGARLASMTAGGLGIVENGLVAARDGRIMWAGAAERAPALMASETIDCGGRWITPGLIDCHTHLVYAGNRTNEFAMRLAGADYAAIARAGGGILSTMRATRAASELELVGSALPRLDALIAEGVTTVEIKSGYGLSPIDEMKMLRTARRLGNERQVSVSTTFLGAHAVPPEFAGRSDDYVDLLCDVMIPAAASAGLANAVDGFCETIAFTPAQIDRLFAAAAKAGLPVKLHAEQLSDSGGAALAARHRALSADHLEHVSHAGIAAMAASGTVAVLLPGAFYFLRETRKPPVAELRAAGVPIAIATDCNPGTSPLASPLVTMNFAAVLFGLTPAEALAGMTINAARALGLHEQTGSLEAGKWCDLAIWDIDTPEELVCQIGPNPLWQRIRWGQ
ncbi:imidazolonepropionase [Novosphingobium sp.]|uniref:imidazolonepropionase n=1 Tax=Novosphingobium sp. TaxID=1874826 RepID=UPI001D513561|nr:imidazolonepropionase [Novosphingobium sp.]MBX9665642.1 imidazolonepropionase [Novosphingobium sp.]